MATTSAGVPAGASRPYQPTASKSATPACAMVGTSGSTAERSGVLMPRATSRPDLTSGATEASDENAMSTCPPATSVLAGPSPL
ncbi:Uncharacterised protein [Bordetella pertussis]|nr:Uncharacterised protein [Bordetella pertussis]CFP52655.1 Uncharacterised protein [Bordetella pertussis]CFU64406.1 Uncharacterised protein [Bordetella pertussis]CPJ24718.1 Uncharacterised protein [Bordetella pertussis]CPL14769.1 Uncharacterised protein [Bordetella pertussis]